MGIYCVDGNFVNEEAASIPINDLGLLRGYGVFDFLRTYEGTPFFLIEHLQRLQRSATYLGIACSWSLEALQEMVLVTLRKNSYNESNIRIVITGGDSLDSITPMEKSRVLVMVTELIDMPASWYVEGVKVMTADITRYIPEAKSTNYIKAIVAMKKARKEGAVESLYMDTDGNVLEGTTSNLFMVKDGAVVTPGSDVLLGITRQVVLDLLESQYKTEQRPLTRNELIEADEVFLTASNKEVVPVVQVDDVFIGEGKPGPVTLRVIEMFREFTKSYAKGK